MYVEARFFRPTGLGNRLFPWARAKVFSAETSCRMLAPRWGHLRAASITRGGINYGNALRKVLLFDNFAPLAGEVGGIESAIIRRMCKVFAVATLSEARGVADAPGERILVSFKGNEHHLFDDLWIHYDLIRDRLLKAAKPKWLSEIARYGAPFIGLNVRMGKDFKPAQSVADFASNSSDYLRTPLDWYVDALRLVRQVLGTDMPAVVVTDGTRFDLRQVLDEPSVIFCDSRSAIGDLLILSKATVLIGSGRSSFSAWASFLGKMPTVTVPGSSLQKLQVSKDLEQHFVGELDVQNPSAAVTIALRVGALSQRRA
jgi:hypothetical protein